MKKVALSLASVLAAAAFAPEASAVPAFARQTGMACTACHQQHFPVLNSFGRAFKASGFTIMGSQGKIEGEGLSIPDTLNAAVLLKVRYRKTDGADPVGTVSGTTKNTWAWDFPDELGLFFAGRVAEAGPIKVGMMMENNLLAAGASPLIAGLRVPVVVDLGGVSVQAVPFSTDGLGAFYGYTESSNGINRAIRWTENRTEVYAHQFTGLADGAATGIAFVAKADMGYASVTRFASTFGSAVQMSSTAVHLAATPTIADWATIISLEMISGENFTSGGTYPGTAVKVGTKGSGFSAQAQGQLAGMDTSLYFANSKADKTAATALFANIYNGNAFDRTATQFGIDVSVIPHTLHLGANLLTGKTGVTSSETEKQLTLAAVYDVVQNVALVWNYSMGSGSAFDAGGSKDAVTVAGSGAKGAKSLMTLMLEAAW